LNHRDITWRSLSPKGFRTAVVGAHLERPKVVSSETNNSDTNAEAELTDEQWTIVAPLIAVLPTHATKRGRPRRDSREVLSGVLWVLRHNAPWQELPDQFPSYQTCHRRFQQWVNDGTLRQVLEVLERDLRERGGLEVTEWLTHYTSVGGKIAGDAHEAEDKQAFCWQQQTAMLFLSPATLRLLHRLRSPLARKLSLRYLPQAKCFVSACAQARCSSD
jgi:transposase